MAMQTEIQYVCYRYDGTSALQPVAQTNAVARRDTHSVARPRKQKAKRINMVSVLAVVMMIVMLASIVVTLVRMDAMRTEEQLLQNYIVDLEADNVTLQEQYRAGYDLEDIRQKALAMGMVPKDQVEQIILPVQLPQQEQEQTVWDQIGIFLAGLFA